MSQDRTNAKKLFIKTWGCQMNVYDSRRMADILAPLGYTAVEEADDADMIILNTCHIREKATDKVFSEIGRMREIKEEKKAKGENTIIAVAGCVAQAEGDFIMERAPAVDMVFGPQAYHELPEMMLRAGVERVVNTDLATENKFDSLPEAELTNPGPAAFLSVQEGCDKFCTFCVVPYTRGAESSRKVEDVLSEARRLIDLGVKEITLLGQNVNAYHGQHNGSVWSLGRLIDELAQMNGLHRIRYMTSHPRDMEDDLIFAHRDIPKLMPYMHLPVQSGSDAILKAMNRKHKADLYREIIAKVRSGRPDIALSSDFIVGFPGETDQDFEDTMQLVRDIGYQSAYSFKYSPRPGTPAAAIQAAQIQEDVKQERLLRLQDLLTSQFEDFNRRTIGLTVPVLFERKGAKDGQLQGRTPYNQSINVPAKERLIGQIVGVSVTSASATALKGEIETFENIAKSA